YNSKTVMPTSLNSRSKGNDPNCTEHSKYQASAINMEETTFEVVEHSVQHGMTVQCNPLQVTPFPLPVGKMPLCSENDTVMQQMIYTESGHQFWSTSPSVWLRTTTETNSSHQPTQEDQGSVEGGIPDGENTRSSSYHYAAQEQEEQMEVDKQRHILSAAGESGSSSICNGGRSQPDTSVSGSVLSGTTAHMFATNIFRPITVRVNDEVKSTHEGTKVTDGSMSRREMALNKFRLKRKERCFEKKVLIYIRLMVLRAIIIFGLKLSKLDSYWTRQTSDMNLTIPQVRYHARKLLAEQRPRVKGQFVCQAKLNPQPTIAGAFQSDPAAW
ncbi:hypothetical protein BHE74_00046944, partial [Ensete ventricosum]